LPQEKSYTFYSDKKPKKIVKKNVFNIFSRLELSKDNSQPKPVKKVELSDSEKPKKKPKPVKKIESSSEESDSSSDSSSESKKPKKKVKQINRTK
jgi:hypothetical protein